MTLKRNYYIYNLVWYNNIRDWVVIDDVRKHAGYIFGILWSVIIAILILDLFLI